MWEMLLSGASGATASIMGKIAFSPHFPAVMIATRYICVSFLVPIDHHATVNLAVRVLFGGLMFYFNAVMLSKFLKALETNASLPVTVVCSSVNFICTGLLGYAVLGENVNQQWCTGALLIIGGVYLVLKSTKATPIRK